MGCPTTTQDSLPDGWPAFPGGTDCPLGPSERFQVIPFSSPRLCLAHRNYTLACCTQCSPGSVLDSLPDLTTRVQQLTLIHRGVLQFFAMFLPTLDPRFIA